MLKFKKTSGKAGKILNESDQLIGSFYEKNGFPVFKVHVQGGVSVIQLAINNGEVKGNEIWIKLASIYYNMIDQEFVKQLPRMVNIRPVNEYITVLNKKLLVSAYHGGDTQYRILNEQEEIVSVIHWIYSYRSPIIKFTKRGDRKYFMNKDKKICYADPSDDVGRYHYVKGKELEYVSQFWHTVIPIVASHKWFKI